MPRSLSCSVSVVLLRHVLVLALMAPAAGCEAGASSSSSSPSPSPLSPSSPYLSPGSARAPATPVWNPAIVDEIAALAATSGSRAFLLARGDEVVVSALPEGHGPFPVASISKAISALAVARAVDEGAVSFDDKVSGVVVTWRGDARDGVTWRALLSHTSGLSDDLTKLIDPGLPRYHLQAYNVVPAAIAAWTSVDFATFVNDHVIRPAGGSGIEWKQDGEGRALAAAGARVSVDDLLAIGRLVLRGGKTPRGEVLRARTLDEMFHAHGRFARNHALGWWLQHASDDALTWDIVEARGASGHMVTVLPARQAVLVRIGSDGNDTGIPERFHALLRQL
jgi:CubicO group peptidase (beta-lactamase class C family)